MDRTLEELRQLAAREGLDAEGVMKRTGCGGYGGGCGLCAPYIRAAVALGVNMVPVSGEAELAEMVRRAGRKENGPDAGASGPSVG